MKVLMVMTSHDQLGDTGKKTGFWYEEFAAPYYAIKDADHSITLASPKGGRPPIDPKSDDPASDKASVARCRADTEAQAALNATLPLSSVKASDFDAVFYVGGHGPLWDLSDDRTSIALIEAFNASGKPIAALCHGPSVLRHVKGRDGKPIVAGRKVAGFSNAEEEQIGLSKVVPFLLETMLTENGGLYSTPGPWKEHAVADGNLITGQNPPSSDAVGALFVKQLAAGS